MSAGSGGAIVDDAVGAPDGVAVGHGGAGLLEGGVGDLGAVTRTTLDHDLDPARLELAHDIGDEGDAALARRGLLRDGESHRARTLTERPPAGRDVPQARSDGSRAHATTPRP